MQQKQINLSFHSRPILERVQCAGEQTKSPFWVDYLQSIQSIQNAKIFSRLLPTWLSLTNEIEPRVCTKSRAQFFKASFA